MVNYLATRLGTDLMAGVPFSGSAPNLEDVPKIRCPLLVQSAENDPRINASWPDHESALQAAARLAWERTIAFFNEHVRS